MAHHRTAPLPANAAGAAPLRFGLAGFGHHGRNAVAPAMARSSGARLAAVADPSAECRAALTAEGVRAYPTVDQMLRSESLDALYVATPVEAHAEGVLAGLAAGLHVITEKPMAATVAECRAMVAAAEKAGKTLAVDFESRCIPRYRKIRRWIAEGRIGAVHAVHLDHFWDGHKTVGPLSRRRERFLNRSGCLDCGIHKIDLVRYFVGGGEWRRVQALGAWFGEKVRLAPHIAILAALDNGVLVTINASFAFNAYIPARLKDPNFNNMAIIGEKGVIVHHHSADGRSELELLSASESVTEAALPGTHAVDIAQVLDLFCDAVRQGKPLPPEIATGHDGLMAQFCMDEANRLAVEAGDSALPNPRRI